MEPRLDYYTASPEALKAILALEAATFDLSIEKPLLDDDMVYPLAAGAVLLVLLPPAALWLWCRRRKR